MPYENGERLAKFYSNAFGWKMQMVGSEMGNYVVAATTETDEKGMVKTPGNINGGFFPKNPEATAIPSMVIAVTDIKAAIKNISDAGGKVFGRTHAYSRRRAICFLHGYRRKPGEYFATIENIKCDRCFFIAVCITTHNYCCTVYAKQSEGHTCALVILFSMKIENCDINDIDEVFRLYAIASAYQRSKNVVVWPPFERKLVETEIAENRQWKLLIDGAIACNWAVTYSDSAIWEERDNKDSIYIHRITTNPGFRGRNFVAVIVDWAKAYAKEKGKRFIRLDTLGNNIKLITHYTNAGFDFLGMFRLKNTVGLPMHYQEELNCC